MHPEVIVANWQLIASGVSLTLQIACVALLIGTLLGVLVAVARINAPAPIAALATGYVEAMRNTPVLVQLLALLLQVVRRRQAQLQRRRCQRRQDLGGDELVQGTAGQTLKHWLDRV